ncbi:hypothetical protein LINGRAHAP2_LOCUS36117 [Linum grandiflorum]
MMLSTLGELLVSDLGDLHVTDRALISLKVSFAKKELRQMTSLCQCLTISLGREGRARGASSFRFPERARDGGNKENAEGGGSPHVPHFLEIVRDGGQEGGSPSLLPHVPRFLERARDVGEEGERGRRRLPSLSRESEGRRGRRRLPSLSRESAGRRGRRRLPSLSRESEGRRGRRRLPRSSLTSLAIPRERRREVKKENAEGGDSPHVPRFLKIARDGGEEGVRGRRRLPSRSSLSRDSEGRRERRKLSLAPPSRSSLSRKSEGKKEEALTRSSLTILAFSRERGTEGKKENAEGGSSSHVPRFLEIARDGKEALPRSSLTFLAFSKERGEGGKEEVSLTFLAFSR